MNGFVILGYGFQDKVFLMASSCLYNATFERRNIFNDVGYLRSMAYPEHEMKLNVGELVSVTEDSYVEAWPNLTKLWQPPESKQLATAILLGQKPKPNPLLNDLSINVKTWFPNSARWKD